MRTIPQIRDALHEIASAIQHYVPGYAAKLHELADETKRRPAVRPRRRKRPPLTEKQVEDIQTAAREFPDESYHKLSILLDINTARISEVLAGKREDA